MSIVTVPAQAEFELPEGEKITNVPVVPRAIPQKEEYELYDPKIGKNFDLSKFWVRGDLRVRPVMRNGGCFGSALVGPVGNCNTFTGQTSANGAPGKANDFFVQQLTRLGFGYDLSPDLNFYMELQDSRTWGGNGSNGAGASKTIQGTKTGVRQPMVGVTVAHWGSELPTCWFGILLGSRA
jgi:hypothetical protein